MGLFFLHIVNHRLRLLILLDVFERGVIENLIEQDQREKNLSSKAKSSIDEGSLFCLSL